MQRPLTPSGVEGDGHGARFAGAFLLGLAARLQQMYRTKAPAGVIISSSSCIWVSFKPEWAFNVMAHVRDWEHAETVRRRCPSGQLEALRSAQRGVRAV